MKSLTIRIAPCSRVPLAGKRIRNSVINVFTFIYRKYKHKGCVCTSVSACEFTKMGGSCGKKEKKRDEVKGGESEEIWGGTWRGGRVSNKSAH